MRKIVVGPVSMAALLAPERTITPRAAGAPAGQFHAQRVEVRPNASATRMLYGSKYPGILLRELRKTNR